MPKRRQRTATDGRATGASIPSSRARDDERVTKMSTKMSLVAPRADRPGDEDVLLAIAKSSRDANQRLRRHVRQAGLHDAGVRRTRPHADEEWRGASNRERPDVTGDVDVEVAAQPRPVRRSAGQATRPCAVRRGRWLPACEQGGMQRM